MRQGLIISLRMVMHLLAFASAALFLWIWLSAYQDIAATEATIEAHTGLRYLLLPLSFPLLHLISFIGSKFNWKNQYRTANRQGDFLLIAVIALFTLGWLLENQYFTMFEKHLYYSCKTYSSGIRSTFLLYAKETYLCPI